MLGAAGSFADGDDHTDEERKLMNETRKILGDESIRVSATCVRVPVVTGHSESVNVETRDEDLGPSAAASCWPRRRAWSSSTTRPPGATRPRSTPPATTTSSSGASAATRRHERALDLWVVADNLRKGAATNAVQIAELLHERGLRRPGAAQRRLRLNLSRAPCAAGARRGREARRERPGSRRVRTPSLR